MNQHEDGKLATDNKEKVKLGKRGKDTERDESA